MSTTGVEEEAGGRVGWGLQISFYEVETGEGGCSPLPVSPSHLTVLLLPPFGRSHSPMAILPRKPCVV